jgi:hypothetical protein
MKSTKFEVRQTFETLGESARQTFATSSEADAYAAELRKMIAEMVCEMDATGNGLETGYAPEVEAWKYADYIADGDTYGRRAGEYIADQAVVIEEVEA